MTFVPFNIIYAYVKYQESEIPSQQKLEIARLYLNVYILRQEPDRRTQLNK